MKTEHASYSKKEEALFAKMRSLRLQRWYNNRLSKIDSKERFWLIVFTRPQTDEENWKLKFWVWDSQENKIFGQNVLFYYVLPGILENKHFLGCNIVECYIQRDFEYVVFRNFTNRSYLIYDFSGNLLIQTEKITEQARKDDVCFSKFLEKNIFFSHIGGLSYLYHLDQKTGVSPKCTQILSDDKVLPKKGDINVFLQGQFCIIHGYDFFNDYCKDTLWIYSCQPQDSCFYLKTKISLKSLEVIQQIKETKDNLCLYLDNNLLAIPMGLLLK